MFDVVHFKAVRSGRRSDPDIRLRIRQKISPYQAAPEQRHQLEMPDQ